MREKTIYALGFFDGVHLGHQALLTACKHLAKQNNCLAGAVTFGSHPEALVKGKPPMLINTVKERCRILVSYGIQTVELLPFDEKLRSLPWETFLEQLLAKGAAGFVCGDDFRFGYRGEGNAEKLTAFCEERGLFRAVVSAQNLDGTRISSTHIRSLLESGDIEEANRFLGHPHLITGTVVPGRQLGRTIGIPTANLRLEEGVICPRFGVYAAEAVVEGKKYPAVTNIGTRPTVEGDHVTVEPWLLDFDGDLYGKHLTLLLHYFLRPEQKFPSLEALQAQIRADAKKTRDLLGANGEI